jgi:16S rRNA (cytidine1402-2'-O)-methyltransferase
VSASGLPAGEFAFFGFLPSRRAARRARLEELADIQSTLVFYEAPHRINETLADAGMVFGQREYVVARELTKLHEEFVRGTFPRSKLPEGPARGEIVLLIGPPLKGQAKQEAKQGHSIIEDVELLIESEGLDRKSALKRIARERGISKSEAYRRLLAERRGSE